MTGWRRIAALFSPILFLLTFAPTAANAQWGVTKHPVSASARIEPAEARRGEQVKLIVTVEVEKEYHIYAMDLRGAEGPIPTEITFAEDAPQVLDPAGAWVEPKPTVKFDKGFEVDIPMHYGSPLEFTRTFTVKPDAAPGEYSLAGVFYVQACTEESCLPPSERTWGAKLTVLEGEPVAVPPPAVANTDPVAEAAPPAPAPQKGLLAFMVGAFGFGLLALLTPCVFPMIPITVTFFTNKAAKSTFHAARAAGIYVLSIIGGFTVIGFGFSLLLLALGRGVESSGFANMLAANPWVNIFFALLYIVFAFALLEVVMLSLPSKWTNRINQKAIGRTDALGIVFKAQVFVLISFTCTAPLLGLLIVQTLSGEWTRPLLGMMAFATGFSLPFFALAMVPQLIGTLPKSGSWLYSIKVVMALLVFAASFKFISNADIVLLKDDMIFTREVLLAIWTTIAAVTAFYLFRFIRLKAEEDASQIGVGRLMAGTLFGAVAIYMAAGLFGTQLHPWVESYMPPNLRADTQVAAAAPGSALPESRTRTGGAYISAGYSWYTEVDEAMAQAKKLNRNLFIDFTGYSCTNCRLMEKTMFPRQEVSDLLEEYVRLKLYTDDRERGAERRAYQAKLFGTVALPFYAIMTPDGQVLAKEEYTQSVERYVDFLKKGVKGQEVALQ
jgi:thiol:disulfide interchange protein DsbD